MNAFENIVKWNEERGLIENGFNHEKEASFIIEELLESTGGYDSMSARERAATYAKEIVGNSAPTDEDVVDAFADIIVFATGAIKKKGYDPSKVMEEVCKEINSRTGKLEGGKFVKDKDAILYQADLESCKCK
jgi:predicted HAD superfamily Cof-like phosphohydrolase